MNFNKLLKTLKYKTYGNYIHFITHFEIIYLQQGNNTIANEYLQLIQLKIVNKK